MRSPEHPSSSPEAEGCYALLIKRICWILIEPFVFWIFSEILLCGSNLFVWDCFKRNVSVVSVDFKHLSRCYSREMEYSSRSIDCHRPVNLWTFRAVSVFVLPVESFFDCAYSFWNRKVCIYKSIPVTVELSYCSAHCCVYVGLFWPTRAGENREYSIVLWIEKFKSVDSWVFSVSWSSDYSWRCDFFKVNLIETCSEWSLHYFLKEFYSNGFRFKIIWNLIVNSFYFILHSKSVENNCIWLKFGLAVWNYEILCCFVTFSVNLRVEYVDHVKWSYLL